jgi:hypothetical protein
MEFGYIDLVDPDTGEYYLNPSIPDKDAVTHIQDFKVGRVVAHDEDGNSKVYQFRGWSGWYFQASASTAVIDVNVTQQSELNPGTNRSGWKDITEYWYNRPQFVSPPVHDGKEFFGIDYLFRGLTEFEGHSFGEYVQSYVDSNGNYVFPSFRRMPGPIRMSYLYGPQGDSANKINHQLRFSLSGKCNVMLHGRFPGIRDWSSEFGSYILPSKATTMLLKPGSDNLILIDGRNAIRIRLNGWHAHFGDHIMKPENNFPSFYAGGAGNFLTYGYPFSTPCEDASYGDDTSERSLDENGNWVYGSAFELSGGHHFHIGRWIEANQTKGLDRFNIKAVAKAWKKLPGDYNPPESTGLPRLNRPDPYNVILKTEGDRPADEVVYTTATPRKTVHEFDPDHNEYGIECDPAYADSMGFIFNFKEPLNHYGYVHISWYYDGVLIGVNFRAAVGGGADSYITGGNYAYAIPWKATDKSLFPGYGGDLPIPPSEKDPDHEGAPLNGEYEAYLVCIPFGPNNTDFLPTCGFHIPPDGKGSAGKPYTFIPWTYLPRVNFSGASIIKTVTLDWGDGLADACFLDTPIKHQWDTAGDYTISMEVTYTEASGRGPDRSKTYIRVAP